MPNLLVATPGYLLRFDTEARRTFVIEEGHGEYYGISWFGGADDIVVSRSCRNDNEFESFADLVRSEKGVLTVGSRRSQPFLSQPHQILCVGEDVVLATNTGRNQIAAVNVHDWSVRQVRLGAEMWDRDENMTPVGVHLNSLDSVNGKIYALEHNWERGSTLAILDWPSLEIVERRPLSIRGAHNVWVRNESDVVVCDTIAGSIREANSGKVLWRSQDPQTLTRGLAASSTSVFVGASQPARRGDRFSGPTGVWVLDIETMRAVDYVMLGRFGAVHEIRLLDTVDLCHRNGPIRLSTYLRGLPTEDFWTRGKLACASRRFLTDEDGWNIHLSSLELFEDNWMSTIGDDLTLVTLSGCSPRDLRLSFEIDMSDPHSHQMDLVWHFRGPGDSNFGAALFVRTPHGISVEVGRMEDAQWVELGRTFWPRLRGVATAIVHGDRICVTCGGNDARLEVHDTTAASPGEAGIRAVRARVRHFRIESLETAPNRA